MLVRESRAVVKLSGSTLPGLGVPPGCMLSTSLWALGDEGGVCLLILSRCLRQLQTPLKCLPQLWPWFLRTLPQAPCSGLLWEAFEHLARQGGAQGSRQVAEAARSSLEQGDVGCLRALHAFACCEGCDAREAGALQVESCSV